jgi:hypothetical protein
LLGFTPNVTDAFTILTAGEGVLGEFENLNLPAGYQWNVAYNANDVVLTVTGLASLAGDFNSDGSVDAADYVLWRKTAGSPMSYAAWKTSFGASGGSGGNSPSVPEPTALLLFAIASCGLAFTRTR